MRRKKQKGVGISFVKVTRKLRLKTDSHTDTLELFHLAWRGVRDPSLASQILLLSVHVLCGDIKQSLWRQPPRSLGPTWGCQWCRWWWRPKRPWGTSGPPRRLQTSTHYRPPRSHPGSGSGWQCSGPPPGSWPGQSPHRRGGHHAGDAHRVSGSRPDDRTQPQSLESGHSACPPGLGSRCRVGCRCWWVAQHLRSAPRWPDCSGEPCADRLAAPCPPPASSSAGTKHTSSEEWSSSAKTTGCQEPPRVVAQLSPTATQPTKEARFTDTGENRLPCLPSEFIQQISEDTWQAWSQMWGETMTYVCLSRWEQLKFPWGGHITLYMREK